MHYLFSLIILRNYVAAGEWTKRVLSHCNFYMLTLLFSSFPNAIRMYQLIFQPSDCPNGATKVCNIDEQYVEGTSSMAANTMLFIIWNALSFSSYITETTLQQVNQKSPFALQPLNANASVLFFSYTDVPTDISITLPTDLPGWLPRSNRPKFETDTLYWHGKLWSSRQWCTSRLIRWYKWHHEGM